MRRRLDIAALALLAGAALGLSGGSARAAEPPADELPAVDFEADALSLADEAPDVAVPASDWRGFAEAAVGAARPRGGGDTDADQRLSLDLRYDAAWSPAWRAVFADRLDLSWPAQRGNDNAINTLKEAYFGWQPTADALLDLGRVNARYGVAIGYNPTDYFRAGALRSIVSIDPASLKENRQGSVMLRGQSLWQSGALTVLFSPRLDRHAAADDDGLAPDWGATNDRNRGLIVLSQKLADTVSPQVLLYQEEARPPQFGLNLSGLIGHATVAYLEWSGGRSPSLLNQALQREESAAWRNRLAGGLTYTTAGKLSLTAELQYNGAGLERDAWRALRAGPPAAYVLYRQWVLTAQELPTERALFLYARWQDALINRLDLSAMLNADLVDASRRLWLEARYRGERLDYTLQWQRSGGERLSHYGALPESARWQLAVRSYF